MDFIKYFTKHHSWEISWNLAWESRGSMLYENQTGAITSKHCNQDSLGHFFFWTAQDLYFLTPGLSTWDVGNTSPRNPSPSRLSRFSAVPGKTRTKDKYRVVYSDAQRLELEKEFRYNNYITIKRKLELSRILGLTDRQVSRQKRS